MQLHPDLWWSHHMGCPGPRLLTGGETSLQRWEEGGLPRRSRILTGADMIGECGRWGVEGHSHSKLREPLMFRFGQETSGPDQAMGSLALGRHIGPGIG